MGVTFKELLTLVILGLEFRITNTGGKEHVLKRTTFLAGINDVKNIVFQGGILDLSDGTVRFLEEGKQVEDRKGGYTYVAMENGVQIYHKNSPYCTEFSYDAEQKGYKMYMAGNPSTMGNSIVDDNNLVVKFDSNGSNLAFLTLGGKVFISSIESPYCINSAQSLGRKLTSEDIAFGNFELSPNGQAVVATTNGIFGLDLTNGQTTELDSYTFENGMSFTTKKPTDDSKIVERRWDGQSFTYTNGKFTHVNGEEVIGGGVDADQNSYVITANPVSDYNVYRLSPENFKYQAISDVSEIAGGFIQNGDMRWKFENVDWFIKARGGGFRATLEFNLHDVNVGDGGWVRLSDNCAVGTVSFFYQSINGNHVLKYNSGNGYKLYELSVTDKGAAVNAYSNSIRVSASLPTPDGETITVTEVFGFDSNTGQLLKPRQQSFFSLEHKPYTVDIQEDGSVVFTPSGESWRSVYIDPNGQKAEVMVDKITVLPNNRTLADGRVFLDSGASVGGFRISYVLPDADQFGRSGSKPEEVEEERMKLEVSGSQDNATITNVGSDKAYFGAIFEVSDGKLVNGEFTKVYAGTRLIFNNIRLEATHKRIGAESDIKSLTTTMQRTITEKHEVFVKRDSYIQEIILDEQYWKGATNVRTEVIYVHEFTNGRIMVSKSVYGYEIEEKTTVSWQTDYDGTTIPVIETYREVERREENYLIYDSAVHGGSMFTGMTGAETYEAVRGYLNKSVGIRLENGFYSIGDGKVFEVSPEGIKLAGFRKGMSFGEALLGLSNWAKNLQLRFFAMLGTIGTGVLYYVSEGAAWAFNQLSEVLGINETLSSRITAIAEVSTNFFLAANMACGSIFTGLKAEYLKSLTPEERTRVYLASAATFITSGIAIVCGALSIAGILTSWSGVGAIVAVIGVAVTVAFAVATSLLADYIKSTNTVAYYKRADVVNTLMKISRTAAIIASLGNPISRVFSGAISLTSIAISVAAAATVGVSAVLVRAYILKDLNLKDTKAMLTTFLQAFILTLSVMVLGGVNINQLFTAGWYRGVWSIAGAATGGVVGLALNYDTIYRGIRERDAGLVLRGIGGVILWAALGYLVGTTFGNINFGYQINDPLSKAFVRSLIPNRYNIIGLGIGVNAGVVMNLDSLLTSFRNKDTLRVLRSFGNILLMSLAGYALLGSAAVAVSQQGLIFFMQQTINAINMISRISFLNASVQLFTGVMKLLFNIDLASSNFVVFRIGDVVLLGIHSLKGNDSIGMITVFGVSYSFYRDIEDFGSLLMATLASVEQVWSSPQMWAFSFVIALSRPLLAGLLQNIPGIGHWFKLFDEEALGQKWLYKGNPLFRYFSALFFEEGFKEGLIGALGDLSLKDTSSLKYMLEVVVEQGDGINMSLLNNAYGMAEVLSSLDADSRSTVLNSLSELSKLENVDLNNASHRALVEQVLQVLNLASLQISFSGSGVAVARQLSAVVAASLAAKSLGNIGHQSITATIRKLVNVSASVPSMSLSEQLDLFYGVASGIYQMIHDPDPNVDVTELYKATDMNGIVEAIRNYMAGKTVTDVGSLTPLKSFVHGIFRSN
ncbi:MAG: hypothetical protein QXI58_03190, partial [Candidatus Micrarchaeia archaeon]